MNENFPNHDEKIRSYLKGELSKPEEKLLFDWLDQSPENLHQFQSFIRGNEFNMEISDETEKAWERLHSHIGKQALKKRSGIALLSSRWSRIAAILAVALFFGFWGSHYLAKKQTETTLNELVVPNGEKTQIGLADGTKVWLNAGTKFRYPEDFRGETRTVEIEGEGFFEVAKDPSHPFIVKTPEFEVKVLGTSFNLSSYQNDENNSLSLQSGSVQLSTNNQLQKVKLVPGEKATLNKQENAFKITQVGTENMAPWRDNNLEFNDLSLLEISKLLERQFDVKIQIEKEELKQIKFSGSFKSDEGLDKLLDILKQTSPIILNYKHALKNKEEIIIE